MRIPVWMLFLGAIALIGISAGITLVVVSSKNRHALVRPDYYRDGLKLDAYRAREAAFDSLGVSLALRADGGALVVEARGAKDAGVRERLASLALVLELRRPDDPSADRDVPVTLASDSPPTWVADDVRLRAGRWDVRAVFVDGQGNPVMETESAYDAK